MHGKSATLLLAKVAEIITLIEYFLDIKGRKEHDLISMDTVQTDWNALDTETLRRHRNLLSASLPPLQEVVTGSLIARYTRCGKPNCHCVEGQGHGPHWYLSWRGPKGKTRMLYIPESHVEAVRQRIENHQRIQKVLAEIAEINRELLRRREND